jgi:hypothetical protein
VLEIAVLQGTVGCFRDQIGHVRKGEVVMLLRTICLLIMGIVSFALFLALSEIGVASGM